MARFRDRSTGQYWRQALRGDVMRVYHDTDVACTGASVSLEAFGHGQQPPAPAPLVTTAAPHTRPARPRPERYPCPETTRLVVAEQAARQAGAVPAAAPLSRPTVQASVCKHCRAVGCTCERKALIILSREIDAAVKQKGRP